MFQVSHYVAKLQKTKMNLWGKKRINELKAVFWPLLHFNLTSWKEQLPMHKFLANCRAVQLRFLSLGIKKIYDPVQALGRR